MSQLERRYRRLLAWYPHGYREVYQDEMLGVLLDAAGPERTRPTIRETADLLTGALRYRLPQAGSRGHQWRRVITGLIVSVLMIGVATTAIVALSNSTLADPGCSAGKDAAVNGPDDLNDPYSMQKMINNLRVAAEEATHDNVRAAVTALADDYTRLLNATATGSMPNGLTDKLTTDATTIDSLCSIGG